jgi:hypothetical protein
MRAPIKGCRIEQKSGSHPSRAGNPAPRVSTGTNAHARVRVRVRDRDRVRVRVRVRVSVHWNKCASCVTSSYKAVTE